MKTELQRLRAGRGTSPPESKAFVLQDQKLSRDYVNESKVNSLIDKINRVQRHPRSQTRNISQFTSELSSPHAPINQIIKPYERIKTLQANGADISKMHTALLQKHGRSPHEDPKGGQTDTQTIEQTLYLKTDVVPRKGKQGGELVETSVHSSLLQNQCQTAYQRYEEDVKIVKDQRSFRNQSPIMEKSKDESLLQSAFPVKEFSQDTRTRSPSNIKSKHGDGSMLECTLQANTLGQKDMLMMKKELMQANPGIVATEVKLEQKRLSIEVQSKGALENTNGGRKPTTTLSKPLSPRMMTRPPEKPKTAGEGVRKKPKINNMNIDQALLEQTFSQNPTSANQSGRNAHGHQDKSHHNNRNTRFSGATTNMATYYMNQRHLIQTAGNVGAGARIRRADLGLTNQSFLDGSKIGHKKGVISVNENWLTPSEYGASFISEYAKNAILDLQSQIPDEFQHVGNADIHSRLYSRDGSITETGKPFFIEQIGKNRMIRTNKSFRHREKARFKSNCVPIGSNYIHDRIKINQKHFQKCKGMQMEIFENQINEQKRQQNQSHQEKGKSSMGTGEGERRSIEMKDQGVGNSNNFENTKLGIQTNKLLSSQDDGFQVVTPGIQRGFFGMHNELGSACDADRIQGHLYSNQSSRESHQSPKANALFAASKTSSPTKRPKGKSIKSSKSPGEKKPFTEQSYDNILVESPTKSLYRKQDQMFELAVFNSFNLGDESLFVQNQKSIKYEPIQSRLQRLSSQQLMHVKESQRPANGKTPEERRSGRASHNRNGAHTHLKVITTNTQSRQTEQAGPARARFNQTSIQLQHCRQAAASSTQRHTADDSKKPIWVFNKKPRSTVVNYKSVQGKGMKKLSQGDPDKIKWQNLKNVLRTQVLEPQRELSAAMRLDQAMSKPQTTKATYGLKDLKVGINQNFKAAYAHKNKDQKKKNNFENLNRLNNNRGYNKDLVGKMPEAPSTRQGSIVVNCDEIPTVKQELEIQRSLIENQASDDTSKYTALKQASQPNFKIQDIVTQNSLGHGDAVDGADISYKSNPLYQHRQQPRPAAKVLTPVELADGDATNFIQTQNQTSQVTAKLADVGNASLKNLNALPLDNSIIAKSFEASEKMKSQPIDPGRGSATNSAKEHVGTLQSQENYKTNTLQLDTKERKSNRDAISFGKKSTNNHKPGNASQEQSYMQLPMQAAPQGQSPLTQHLTNNTVKASFRDVTDSTNSKQVPSGVKTNLDTISSHLGPSSPNNKSVDVKSNQSKVVYQKNKANKKDQANIQYQSNPTEEDNYNESEKKGDNNIVEIDCGFKVASSNTNNNVQRDMEPGENTGRCGSRDDAPPAAIICSSHRAEEHVSHQVKDAVCTAAMSDPNSQFNLSPAVVKTFDQGNQILIKSSNFANMDLHVKIDQEHATAATKTPMQPASTSKQAAKIKPNDGNHRDKIDNDLKFAHMKEAVTEGFQIKAIEPKPNTFERYKRRAPIQSMMGQAQRRAQAAGSSGTKKYLASRTGGSVEKESVTTVHNIFNSKGEGPVSHFTSNDNSNIYEKFSKNNKLTVEPKLISSGYPLNNTNARQRQLEDDHSPATSLLKGTPLQPLQPLEQTGIQLTTQRRCDTEDHRSNISQGVNNGQQRSFIESEHMNNGSDDGNPASGHHRQELRDISSKAATNLNDVLRQPIHRNPPKYLQKESFGMKYQYQSTMQQRRRTGTTTSRKVAAGESNFNSFMSSKIAATESNGQQQSVIQPDENLNIKNLCNQTRSRTTHNGRFGHLKSIGAGADELVQIQDESVLLARRSQLSSGQRNPKHKEFYDLQLGATKCERGKSYISADCDPAYRLDSGPADDAAAEHALLSHEYMFTDLEKGAGTLGESMRAAQTGTKAVMVKADMQFEDRHGAADIQSERMEQIKSTPDGFPQTQTFSIQNISVHDKKAAGGAPPSQLDETNDYNERTYLNGVRALTKHNSREQGRISKTGSFESNMDINNVTPMDQREEPQLAPTMDVSKPKSPAIPNNMSNFSSSVHSPINSKNAINCESRISHGGPSQGLSYNQQMQLLQQYNSDQAQEGRLLNPTMARLPLTQIAAANQTGQYQIQNQEGNFPAVESQSQAQQTQTNQQSPPKKEQVKVAAQPLARQEQKPRRTSPNKSNFRKGVHRDFKGLVVKDKEEGLIDMTDSHLRQFKRSRSKTLIQQLVDHRNTRSPVARDGSVLVLLSNQAQVPAEHTRTSSIDKEVHPEFINPMKLIQDNSASIRVPSQISENRKDHEAIVRVDAGTGQAGPPSQTENRDTLEMAAAAQNEGQPSHDGKITIDSTGFQELYRVSNAVDEENVQEEVRIQAQNLMGRLQAEPITQLQSPGARQPAVTRSTVAPATGGRHLFELPTSLIEDLYREQRELDLAAAADFGLQGQATELKPLGAGQFRPREPLQRFFANKEDKSLFSPKKRDMDAARDHKVCKRLARVQELEEKIKASRRQQHEAQQRLASGAPSNLPPLPHQQTSTTLPPGVLSSQLAQLSDPDVSSPNAPTHQSTPGSPRQPPFQFQAAGDELYRDYQIIESKQYNQCSSRPDVDAKGRY